MLKEIKITSYSPALQNVENLYLRAFPENERSPLHLLLDDPTNCSEIFAFYDKDIFCGFLSLLTYKDISHIIYFAVEENLRGTGYGSAMLTELKRIKPNYRLLADIELPSPSAENNSQREKRKEFYLRNGYATSKVSYDWRNEDYEILVNGGGLSELEFWEFWEAMTKINPEYAKF